jgi:hypothetical protein
MAIIRGRNPRLSTIMGSMGKGKNAWALKGAGTMGVAGIGNGMDDR